MLDEESLVTGLASLTESCDFRSGDRVKTLRGSTRGVIVRVQADGRVVWTPDGSRSELLAQPESLLREKQ